MSCRRVSRSTRLEAWALRLSLLHVLSLNIVRMHLIWILIVVVIGIVRQLLTKLSVVLLHLLLICIVRWLKVRHLVGSHVSTVLHLRTAWRAWSALLHMRRVWLHHRTLRLELRWHVPVGSLVVHGTEPLCGRVRCSLVEVLVVVASRPTVLLRSRHVVLPTLLWVERHRRGVRIRV